MTDNIVRALRVEIAKPLNTDWETIGPKLRALRSVCSRMTNAATLDVISAVRAGGKSAPYQAVKLELSSCQEHTKNETLKTIQVSSRIVDACSQRGAQAAKRWLKNPGAGRIPSDKPRGPIYIRDGAWSVDMDPSKGAHLSVALFASPEKKVTFALRPSHGSHWSKVKQLANGNTEKLGDCKIMYDENARKENGSRGKWFAVLAYQEKPPEKPKGLDPKRALVVHRGMHNLLTLASSDKPSRIRRVRGFKYMSQRRKLNERARQMRMSSKEERGQGAKGHGVQRRFETHDALDNKLKAINKTFCQQLGAMVARLSVEWGCGRVVIEDYGGLGPSEDRGERRFIERFPFYQLKESIAWALKKRGLSLEEAAPEYISQTCLQCDHQDASNHNRRTGVFKCQKCGFTRDADAVALMHMMLRCGASEQLEKEFEIQRKLKKLRDAELSATGSPEGQKRPTPRRKREGKTAREPGKDRDIRGLHKRSKSQRSPSSGSSRAELSTARKPTRKSKKRKGT